jgi:hypothetical protein
MKRPLHGPSLYYASDKNIFDALNQHKVDTITVTKLFERRNILVSKKTTREELAKYFARLSHDYYDHKEIAGRLGIAPRRERITSMDIAGSTNNEDFLAAVDQLKSELESAGDVVHVSRSGDNLSLNIQYSSIDYRRSEFTQVQVRDGAIEFIKGDDGYIVRNTQNEYLNNVRDALLGKLDKSASKPLSRVAVTLFDVPFSKLRSKFFHQLASKLPGYSWRDVTEVYVYKAKPGQVEEEDLDNNDSREELGTHIERVFLRGNGVTRSELLNSLLDEEDYYINKIRWITAEVTGPGNVYEIEAVFTDPKDCTGFSFILIGVYPQENGRLSSRRRQPTKGEVDIISRVIESKARALVTTLRDEYTKLV